MKRRRKRLAGHAFDLQLAGHTISVKWVDDLELDGKPCDGLWLGDADEIHLCSRLTEAKAQETLIHELGHAIADYRGLDFSERVCRTLGLDLQQTLGRFFKRLR